jgi:hypothetical protein
MIIYLDTERSPQAGLVESADDDTAKKLSPFFWNDKFTLDLFIVGNRPSWIGDSSSVVKLRLGTLPDKFYTSPIVGTWSGDHYEFELDLTTSLFDDQIISSLTKSGFVEIQVESGTFSQTLLQQKATFNNTFLGLSVVNLTEPLEPSLVESELLTEPLEPGVPVALSNPPAPSDVRLTIPPLKPQRVRTANFSIIPNAPSNPQSEERKFPPSVVNELRAKIFGMPDAPRDLRSDVVTLRPLAPLRPLATFPTIPYIEKVYAYEVAEHDFHKDHHKYLHFSHTGLLSMRARGQLMNTSGDPFVFHSVDRNGCPIYRRPSTTLVHTYTNPEPDYFEEIRLEKKPDYWAFNRTSTILLKWSSDAKWYNAEGGYTNTYPGFTPVDLPESLDNLDTNIYIVKIALAYRYSFNTSGYPRPNSINLFAMVNEVFPSQDQRGKLGLRNYGGIRPSYFTGQFYDVRSAKNYYGSGNNLFEYPQANHTFTLTPGFSLNVATKPDVPTLPEAEIITEPQTNPSNVSAVLVDFQASRYSPALWLDASQEEDYEIYYDKLTNFSGTSYEVNLNPSTQGDGDIESRAKLLNINGFNGYDFSSTRTSYTIPQNVFGDHFSDGANEVEIFLAYMPLEYDTTTDELNKKADGTFRPYSPHLFVNGDLEGQEDQRFTAHAPWGDDRFYFDAGRVVPSVTARVASSPYSWVYNTRNILHLKCSTRDDVNEIFLNGTQIGTKSAVAEKIFMSNLKFGGWGRSPYGQSMYVHEVLFFRNKLTSNQRQKVEGYLAHKWGITNLLPSGHPYELTAPSNLTDLRPLDPFPRPVDLAIAESYPEAPTSPSAGLLGESPSDVIAEAFPETPSELIAEDIPQLRFYLDEEPISTLVASGYSSDVETLENTIIEQLKKIQIRTRFNTTPTQTTFSVTNVSSTINPSITSQSAGVISDAEINRTQEVRLGRSEKLTLSFNVRVEDDLNNVSELPVSIPMVGEDLTHLSGAIIQNFDSGQLVRKTYGRNFISLSPEDDGTYKIGNLNPQFFPSNPLAFFIPHNSNETYKFQVKTYNPDKVNRGLAIEVLNEHYKPDYWDLPRIHEKVGNTRYVISQGSTIQPKLIRYYPAYSIRTSLRPGGGIITFKNFTEWKFFKNETFEQDGVQVYYLPIEIRCTNISNPDPYNAIYDLEIDFLCPNTIKDVHGNLIKNPLHEMYFSDRFVNGNHYRIGSNYDGTKFGTSLEEVATNPFAGFRIFLNNAFGHRLCDIFPNTYGMQNPSSVKAYNGASVWAKPSKVQQKTFRPKYPVDLAIEPSIKPFYFTEYRSKYQWSAIDKHHFVDPSGVTIVRDSANLVAVGDQHENGRRLPNAGHGTTWVWGIDFKNIMPRVSHTYVHYTELRNVRIADYPYPVIQKPWKYPFEWHLVDSKGQRTTGKGTLDSATLSRLSNTQEKIITFPSGKQIVTEFGGYVQTSGQVKIRIHPLEDRVYSVNTQSYLPREIKKLDYFEFICEPNNIDGAIKPKHMAIDGDGDNKLISVPHLTTPVHAKTTIYSTAQTQESITTFLSPTHCRMSGQKPTRYAGGIGDDEEWDWTIGMLDIEKLNPTIESFYQEFNNYEESKYFFHTESKHRVDDIYNYQGKRDVRWLGLQGKNATPGLNYPTNFMISVHVDASDVMDGSVSDKWGATYSNYWLVDADRNYPKVELTRLEVPNKPSKLKITPSGGDYLITNTDAQFAYNNKPKTPSRAWATYQPSWWDLVKHESVTLDDILARPNTPWESWLQDQYGDDWKKYRIYLRIPKDGEVLYRVRIPNTSQHRQYYVPVKAGDVYRYHFTPGVPYVHDRNNAVIYWKKVSLELEDYNNPGHEMIIQTGAQYSGHYLYGVRGVDNFETFAFQNLYMLNPNPGEKPPTPYIVVKNYFQNFPTLSTLDDLEQMKSDVVGYYLETGRSYHAQSIEYRDKLRIVRINILEKSNETIAQVVYHREEVKDEDGNVRPQISGVLELPAYGFWDYWFPQIYGKSYANPDPVSLLSAT